MDLVNISDTKCMPGSVETLLCDYSAVLGDLCKFMTAEKGRCCYWNVNSVEQYDGALVRCDAMRWRDGAMRLCDEVER